MVLGLFEQYGALNSTPVWTAIRTGLDRLGVQHRFMDMSADVAVIWSVVWAGRMANNRSVWQRFRSAGKNVIVAEVGMLQRGHTWKLGINGTISGCYPNRHINPNRANKLGICLQDWNTQGQNIVIACQRGDSEQWAGQPPVTEWIVNTVKQIQQVSDRPIVVRPHPRQRLRLPPEIKVQMPTGIPNTYDSFDYDRVLKSAWAVINWNSGCGSQAVMSGVPAFVASSSLAAPVGNLDWTCIENPVRPDRNQWINELAHTEWTLDEIASGEPLAGLLGL